MAWCFPPRILAVESHDTAEMGHRADGKTSDQAAYRKPRPDRQRAPRSDLADSRPMMAGLLEDAISAGWMCHTCSTCFKQTIIEIGSPSARCRAPMQTPAWHVRIRGARGAENGSACCLSSYLSAHLSVSHGETRRWQSASRVDSQLSGWHHRSSGSGRPDRAGLGATWRLSRAGNGGPEGS